MPITHSAIKALRKDRARTILNRQTKSRAKTAMDIVKAKPTADALSAAFSAIDRAVKKHVFHKNKGARLKSAVAKLLAQKKTK